MSFSVAQHNAAIEKVTTKNAELGQKISGISSAAQSASSRAFVPQFIIDAINWCAQKISEIATWIWDKVTECLKGAAMPVYMFKYSWDWQDIRGRATNVAGQLNPAALSTDERWQGEAADAYSEAIPPQNAAATKIGAISDSTATALTWCAAAGLAFYVAIGIILAKLVIALVGAIIAIGSAVFSLAGIALVVEEAGVDTALITGAVTALGGVLASQLSQISTLHGQAVDNSTFPGGKWPDPSTAGKFNDSSVKDGKAQWSLKT